MTEGRQRGREHASSIPLRQVKTVRVGPGHLGARHLPHIRVGTADLADTVGDLALVGTSTAMSVPAPAGMPKKSRSPGSVMTSRSWARSEDAGVKTPVTVNGDARAPAVDEDDLAALRDPQLPGDPEPTAHS